MPLLLSVHPFPEAQFGIWHIAEGEAFFRDDLPLSGAEEAEWAEHRNPLRRAEWLAGRWLLHRLSGLPQRLPLAKDAFSKPFFPENQSLSCSLSHSKGNVGALIWQPQGLSLPSAAIGCDIQVLTEKMPRIAPKFLNEAEAEAVGKTKGSGMLDALHLMWTAKESLYKAYGKKGLDFRRHIFVRGLHWEGHSGTAQGSVEKDKLRLEFQLCFGKTELPQDGTPLFWAIARPGFGQ